MHPFGKQFGNTNWALSISFLLVPKILLLGIAAKETDISTKIHKNVYSLLSVIAKCSKPMLFWKGRVIWTLVYPLHLLFWSRWKMLNEKKKGGYKISIVCWFVKKNLLTCGRMSMKIFVVVAWIVGLPLNLIFFLLYCSFYLVWLNKWHHIFP